MAKEHEIVFENLRGTPDLEEASIDLELDERGKGINRVADDEPIRNKRQEADAGIERDPDEGDEGRALDGGADPDEQDDESGYSQKVRKRIDRERKLRQKDREQADYWRQQAEAAQTQLAESRKAASKEQIEALDAQIAQAETELEAAMEAGKSPEQVKLISKITDLKAKRITTELAGQDDAGSDNRPESGKVRPSGGPPKLAREWMDGQSDWYGKPGFERQTRIANRLDKEIFAEGYDVNDPEYYEVLTSRLRKQAPEVFDPSGDDDDASGRGERRSSRSPVAPVSGADGGASSRTSSSKVQLTKADFDNMRQFGLDTNDPEVLKEYARNKREADQDERRNRAGGGR